MPPRISLRTAKRLMGRAALQEALAKSETYGQPRKASHTFGEMNDNERRFSDEYLLPRLWMGEFRKAEFEAHRFVLSLTPSHSKVYTPDFVVDDDIEGVRPKVFEVKGGKAFSNKSIFQDGIVSARWCAQLFGGDYDFFFAVAKGGGFEIRSIKGDWS